MYPCLRTDVRVGHPQPLMLRSGETPGFTPNLDIYYLLGDEKKIAVSNPFLSQCGIILI